MTPAIRWAREPGDLARAVGELSVTGEIALDTEGDSLHHYPERLALVQIGLPDGAVWLIEDAPKGGLFKVTPKQP